MFIYPGRTTFQVTPSSFVPAGCTIIPLFVGTSALRRRFSPDIIYTVSVLDVSPPR